uniref:Uncharacterized protein n=1 Tax=Megaselia scalaris TaxID=36166 RepID=T1GXD4_MEGSC
MFYLGENATKIVCILLTSTLGNKEWNISLPDCEGVVALTATTKYIAVGTDNRFVRFYSVMGTQREVISVPGPIICMAGHKDKVMIAYHSAPANEDQHISIMFVQIFGLNIKCREARLPLPPGRTMSWMGYSTDCGTPVFYDNMGLLQMYSMKGNCWYPMCDTSKHSQSVANNYFIVDVCEKQQIAHAILCRATRYPMTHPRPMVTELPLQMPLFDMTLKDNSEKNIKESAIKLFAMDCRAEKEAKARELVEMIGNPSILELAIKYAGKLGRIHFADRLAEMMPVLQDKESEREKEMQEMEKDAFQILQNTSSLLLMQGCNTPKSDSVKIAPKPMVLSNQKRNPFKRSQNASPQVGSSSPNPFSHLMDKVIEMKPSQDSQEDVIPDSQNIENIIPKRTFVSWFQENKEALQAKHPNASAQELTKLGMTEFRGLSATEKTTKRKLDSDTAGNNMKQAKIDFGQK